MPARHNLPPGSMGLPLLGETLPFLRDPFGFIGERSRAHGPIFKTRLLGRQTVVLVGPEATARFLEPPIERRSAMPGHVEELFGGVSLPLLDGAVHQARKTQILAAFTTGAIAGYLPEMERQITVALERWAARPEVALVPELKRLALEVICATLIGIPAGVETAALGADYDQVLRAFSSLPIRLPGTTFVRGQAALRRIVARLTGAVRERQQTPGNDGLTRILAAVDEEGRRLGTEECAIELHHLIIAGLVVFAELAGIVLTLSRDAKVRERLETELAGVRGPFSAPATLAAAPELLHFVLEVKRSCPIVPVVFARAAEDFSFAGHEVPAGWMVLWAVFNSLQSADTYTAPERFDPDRFSAERAEHLKYPHGYAPQGAGAHRCAGVDFATCMMELFAMLLLSGYGWELAPGQDLSLDWSKIPPEPRGGLRLRLHERASAAATRAAAAS